MSAQHIPGPWKVAFTVGGDMAICADTGRPEFPVATMPVINRRLVNEANARLIARAPEMKDALQAAAPFIRTLGLQSEHAANLAARLDSLLAQIALQS